MTRHRDIIARSPLLTRIDPPDSYPQDGTVTALNDMLHDNILAGLGTTRIALVLRRVAVRLQIWTPGLTKDSTLPNKVDRLALRLPGNLDDVQGRGKRLSYGIGGHKVEGGCALWAATPQPRIG